MGVANNAVGWKVKIGLRKKNTISDNNNRKEKRGENGKIKTTTIKKMNKMISGKKKHGLAIKYCEKKKLTKNGGRVL